jgi:hypothetical protein
MMHEDLRRVCPVALSSPEHLSTIFCAPKASNGPKALSGDIFLPEASRLR